MNLITMSNIDKPLLVVATNNAHKLEELKVMLADHFTVKGMAEVGFDKDIPEDADTFAGNALIKASTIARELNCTCIADDSGLEVDALNGAPGVYSARYAGEPKSDERNLQKVLTDIDGNNNRNARFVTALAYIHKGLEYVFEGEVKGTLLTEKRGSNGFGYDPIFVPNGFKESFAEISADKKNALSHRARAIEKFVAFISAE